MKQKSKELECLFLGHVVPPPNICNTSRLCIHNNKHCWFEVCERCHIKIYYTWSGDETHKD